MIRTEKLRDGLALALAVGMSACVLDTSAEVYEEDEESTSSASSSLILALDRAQGDAAEVARVVMRNGAVITFLEGDDGELMIESLVPAGARVAALEAFDREEIDELELFRRASAQQPPVELVRVVSFAERVQLTLEDEDENDGRFALLASRDFAPELGLGATTLKSTNPFQGMCNMSIWTFAFCWTTRGNPHVQRRSYVMDGSVQAVGGPIRVRARHYLAGWRTFRDVHVARGDTYSVRTSGRRRLRRFEVLNNNAGHLLHFHCRGRN